MCALLINPLLLTITIPLLRESQCIIMTSPTATVTTQNQSDLCIKMQCMIVVVCGAFVGINQGYSLSTNQLNFTTNEVFFLTDDSVISVVNNIFILSATGNYQKYTGGTLDWKVIQLDPDYVSEITVTAPRDDDD